MISSVMTTRVGGNEVWGISKVNEVMFIGKLYKNKAEYEDVMIK